MALIVPSVEKVFIHVPKTGGTWVRRVIYMVDSDAEETGPFEIEDHFGLAEVRREHPRLAHWPAFGFVRKPETWYPSRWAWGRMTNFEEKIKLDVAANAHWMAGVWDNDFNKFMDNVLQQGVPWARNTFYQKLCAPVGYGRGEEWAQVLLYENLAGATQDVLQLDHLPTIPRQKAGAFKMNPELYQLQINQLRRLEEDVYKRWYRSETASSEVSRGSASL